MTTTSNCFQIAWPALQAGALFAVTQLAMAQEMKSATSAVEEVIVTAERVSRSIMSTSSSMTVLDGSEIDRRNLDGANEILAEIPNVTSGGKSGAAPAVRGVNGTGAISGADAFFAGTRSRLNVQIDGRAASHNEVVFGDVAAWDVKQVEMLRGPQSTLQGRNAMAGTLAIKTNDPTYDYQARARIAAGNLQTRQYSVALSGPIVDEQLAFRISADRRTSDSYLEMQPYAGAADPTAFKSTTLRGKLLIEPAALSGFSTLVTIDHGDYSGPQGEMAPRPFDGDVSGIAAVSLWNPRSTTAIVETQWTLNDNWDLRNLLSYADLSLRRIAPPGAGNALIDGGEFVAEPLLRFKVFDGALNGIAGIYFFSSDRKETIDLFGGGAFDDRNRTAAVFTEMTLSISDRFDLTFGSRFESEDHERHGRAGPFVIDLEEKINVFLPKLVANWHHSPSLSYGALVARGYNGGGAGFTYAPPFLDYRFDPEYVLNYEVFLRKTALNGRLQLRGNLFFSDYKDMQIPITLGVLSNVIRNAQATEIYGAELTAAFQATDRWRIQAELGLLHSEVTKYPESTVEGNELPRAPSVTGGMTLQYQSPIGLDLTAGARYSDAFFSNIDNTLRARTQAYWQVNAQIGYSFSQARIFAYGDNLLDSRKPLTITLGATPSLDLGTAQRPRTYGAGIQVNF